MKPLHYAPFAALSMLLGCAHPAAPNAAASAQATSATDAAAGDMEISRAGSRPPTVGGQDHFTGQAVVTPLFATTPHTHAMGASVAFAPGARSAWHTHPAGQTLIVTAGTGWVQQWGGPKVEVHDGDVVWTPPGVKHWHGATADESMTNVAIQEAVDGRVVDWMEHVTDAQYQR